MTVFDAINLLSYGTAYEIKGSYSGKIYHRSWINSSHNLDKYADRDANDTPFYVTQILKGKDTSNSWCSPIIGIWMYDYDLSNGRR